MGATEMGADWGLWRWVKSYIVVGVRSFYEDLDLYEHESLRYTQN